jgi:hypothetical protein
VDQFFQTLQYFRIFTRQFRKQPGIREGRIREREKEKNLSRLASGFVFLLANPEVFLHLASWRVVIHTPVEGVYLMLKEIVFQQDVLHSRIRFTGKVSGHLANFRSYFLFNHIP